MPALDVELMTKDQDLSFQRGPRPEQQDQHRPDQAASFSHKAETLLRTHAQGHAMLRSGMLKTMLNI
jgi:hypothetical protein